MTTALSRILVVDDSPTSRAALIALLKDRYDVHVAGDGLAGVTRSAVVRPHLILLDVQMPVMDGLAACRALRNDMATQATPIIMVTALGDEHDVEEGYTAGCNDYICKPVDKAELLAKVGSWLQTAADQ